MYVKAWAFAFIIKLVQGFCRSQRYKTGLSVYFTKNNYTVLKCQWW